MASYLHNSISSVLVVDIALTYCQETLVHSSNGLTVKALKDAKKNVNFVKACIAFSEVTLPSISTQIKQFNLYLETAEVTLSSCLC